MFLADLMTWWYKKGWGVFRAGFKTRLKDTLDTFSIGELLRTLFKPYRQIAASADGVAESKLAAFFDRLVSRLVGAVTRLVLILAGLVVIVLELLIGGVALIIWPVIPALPVVGIIMTIAGVVL